MDRTLLLGGARSIWDMGWDSLGRRGAATALSRVSAVRSGFLAHGIARTSGRSVREKLAARYCFFLSGAPKRSLPSAI